MTKPQALIGVKGSWSVGSLKIPIRALVWNDDDGTFCFKGSLSLQSLGIHRLLTTFDPGLVSGGGIDDVLTGFVDDLIGPVSMDVDVLWKGEVREFELATRFLDFRFLRRTSGSAVVIRLREGIQDPPKSIQPLLDGIERFRKALSLEDPILAYRKGQGVPLSDLTGRERSASLPERLSATEWLLLSRFAFAEGSTSAKAMSDLLGKDVLDFYLGASFSGAEPSFVASVSMPDLKTKAVEVKGLYLLIELENGRPRFEIHGKMYFPFFDGVEFTVDGSFTATSFSLSAEMSFPETRSFTPRPGSQSIFDQFTLENLGILIGYDAGLTIGAFASITVCRQMVFGAVILTLEGEIPVPRLVSGAIDPIRLPDLFAGATGSRIEGLDVLDILRIDRFPDFQLLDKFRTTDLDNRDCRKVADTFNGNPALAAFPVDANAIRIRPREGGYGLVDQKRMRHYFIDSQGQIFLQPQFYVSEIKTTIGGYSVNPGFFFAGRIAILGKSLEVVFSMDGESGILAFAKLDELEFKIGGFTVFHVCASKDPKKNSAKNPIALPKESPIAQFVPENANGPVFYLSASRKEVAFYFDGHLDLFGIFQFDARILYLSRRISVHAEIVQWGIRVSVLLDADYSSLISKGPSLKAMLQLDTKDLTSRLKSVTDALEETIRTLKASIENANASLDSAQRKVDQLRGQIKHMDDLILSCHQAIDAANWWKKAFVAIAKGAEIGAYEVAKAGIWTAIGVATAALEVAKLAVGAFGHLGAGLLELVNATIRAATSLLFLRKAEITAEYSGGAPSFSASIAFVALGQEYEFKTEVDLKLKEGELFDSLAKGLLDFLARPRENVAKGKPAGPGGGGQPMLKMAMRPVETEDSQEVSSKDAPDIHAASEEVSRLSSILLLMQTRYKERFGKDLAEFSGLNASFASALNVSQSALTTAIHAADSSAFKDLADFVEEQKAITTPSDSLTELDQALNRLKGSIQTHAASKTAIQTTESVRSQWANRSSSPSPTEAEEDAHSKVTDKEIATFLEKLEREIDEQYPKDFRKTGYIDLSRETSLKGYFRSAKGEHPSEWMSMESSNAGSPLRTAAPGYRQRL